MLENAVILPEHLKIVAILTVGFVFATILGYVSERLKMSPILGYLIAGYAIGPYSPGFVADLAISEQLAEVGVILMMFGVGLHLKWQELVYVKYTAIAGALGQTAFTTVIGALCLWHIGWSMEASIVVGLGIGIASTVLLVRVLSERGLHHTPAGHIALSWLLCEDVLAVCALLILPVLALTTHDGEAWSKVLSSFGILMLKFVAWAIFMFIFGRKITTFFLRKVVLTQSHELFSLTILAITFAIAIGSALLTGTSIAMGSFIAGMIIGQTALRRQVSANVMPIRDVFIVIFFLSIGMLFNPVAIVENFWLLLGLLAIIFIGKPLIALLIMRMLKHPFQESLIVAMALAQIGEFSLILAEEASKLHILPDKGYDIIVAGTLISFALNPLLFTLADSAYKKAL